MGVVVAPESAALRVSPWHLGEAQWSGLSCVQFQHERTDRETSPQTNPNCAAALQSDTDRPRLGDLDSVSDVNGGVIATKEITVTRELSSEPSSDAARQTANGASTQLQHRVSEYVAFLEGALGGNITLAFDGHKTSLFVFCPDEGWQETMSFDSPEEADRILGGFRLLIEHCRGSR